MAVLTPPTKKFGMSELYKFPGPMTIKSASFIALMAFGFTREIEGKIAPGVIETVIYNTKKPSRQLIRKNVDEGEPVKFISMKEFRGCSTVGINLLADNLHDVPKVDMLQRTLIRHDPNRLAKAIISIL